MPDVCSIIHLIIRLSDMGIKVIHRLDAIRLLESGQPVDLRVWKLSTGDIIEYKGVICIGFHWRGGTHLVKCPKSGLPRRLRDITLFSINGMEVYL